MITIARNKAGTGLKEAVERMCGAALGACYQCKKCSNGCPVAKLAGTRPSEIMRQLHLGAGEELFASDLLWACASCETCSARCPMGIDVAGVIDALRKLALGSGGRKPGGNVALFNRAFLKTVEIFGRTYELGMVAAYKLGSGRWRDDVEKFPALLKKGKIPLLPPLGGDRRTVGRIFKQSRKDKGAPP